MRAYKSAVFVMVMLTLGAWPVRAQDAQAVEVTPYVAVGSAEASPVGAAVTFPVTSRFSFETDVAYRRGEGRIHALSSSTSLLYALPRVGQRHRMSLRELGYRNTARLCFRPMALLSALSRAWH